MHYDTVGEFRFGVNWLSNAMSRVNLTAARPPLQVGDEPTPIRTDSDSPEEYTKAQRRAAELVEYIAGGSIGQGQILGEFGQHLSVAGFGWLIAEPDLEDEDADEYETWGVYSQDAVKVESNKVMMATGGSGSDGWRVVHPSALVVKCWRRHPRRPWEPDAPVRAVLGILDQIDLLSAHITATGRSRLAGAGMMAIPTEAEFPPAPIPEDGSTPLDPFDYFVENLVETMTVPIRDRDNASSVVPLVVQIPGEYIDKLKHLSFSTPFDAQAKELLTDAIKRLALGLDMPPEILMGMGGVNHWTAWQVEETAVTLHIEPAAEVVCAALTEGYLRAALEAEGLPTNEAIVWYDTSDLTSPPDKSGNVVLAYDRNEVSAAALRRELGLGEDDKPDDAEFRKRVLLELARAAPVLAPALLAEVGIMAEEIAVAPEDVPALEDAARPSTPGDGPSGPDSRTGGTPPRGDRPGVDAGAAVSATIMACDGIVYRAMERAGSRLRSAIGRKVPGGPQAVDHVDPTTLHSVYDATVYADLDALLTGAFDRVPDVAEFLGIDSDALAGTLNAYCRALLASGLPHDRMRLTSALGAEATI